MFVVVVVGILPRVRRENAKNNLANRKTRYTQNCPTEHFTIMKPRNLASLILNNIKFVDQLILGVSKYEMFGQEQHFIHTT